MKLEGNVHNLVLKSVSNVHLFDEITSSFSFRIRNKAIIATINSFFKTGTSQMTFLQ